MQTAESDAENKQKPKPRLIAFDLDYTLWPFWIDTHVTPGTKLLCVTPHPDLSNLLLFPTFPPTKAPIKRNSHGEVVDLDGTIVEFYPDVPGILNEIKTFGDTKIAACSRSHTPKLAREALSLIRVLTSNPVISPKLLAEADGTLTSAPAEEFFDEMEIYPGSKLNHFRAIHNRTGIPYSEMLFFDDETRNREVEVLGVTFIWVVDGLDTQIFHTGLQEWQKRRSEKDA